MNDLTSEIVDKLATYFKTQPSVAAAYLYGSYAKGSETASSDVDVAVLLQPGDQEECRKIQDRLYLEVSRRLRKDVHMTRLILNELELVRQVLSTGICVCVNDPKMHSEFKNRAILEIAEFGYYRKMFQQATIKRVMKGTTSDRS